MTFANPIIRGFNPDPSICRVGRDFYLVTSTFFCVPGCPVYHSRDLVNWRLISHALTTPGQLQLEASQGRPNMFAATLRHHDGVFYVITTDVAGGGNFFVTATDPAGPWSEPVALDSEVFDPSFFFDENGKLYYTRRGHFADRDIVQGELDPVTWKLQGPMRRIALGFVSDDTEGPHLFKRNGWYYLTTAEGGSRFLHMQTIARSRSPWGPFEPCPHNPVIAQHNAWWHPLRSTGHADFFEDADGHSWVVFHGTRHGDYDTMSAIGRETMLAPVEWIDDWPHVATAHQWTLDVESPRLPAPHPWPAPPARHDFSNGHLDPRWVLLSYQGKSRHSLANGKLRLIGGPDAPRNGRDTAWIGLRQEEPHWKFELCLEFLPSAESEEAGLSIYQNCFYHTEIFKTVRAGRPVVVLRRTAAEISSETAPVPVPAGPLVLRLTCDGKTYHFSWSDGGEFHALGTLHVNLLSSEVAGTWTGVLIGPYATGNGRECSAPADFAWVEARAMK